MENAASLEGKKSDSEEGEEGMSGRKGGMASKGEVRSAQRGEEAGHRRGGSGSASRLTR